MVVEHPEGIFIIDTGEVTVVTDKLYFRSSGLLANWFDTSQFRFSVTRADEIDQQLNSICLPKI
jgi:N-acyl homoserine lactone hydrolase